MELLANSRIIDDIINSTEDDYKKESIKFLFESMSLIQLRKIFNNADYQRMFMLATSITNRSYEIMFEDGQIVYLVDLGMFLTVPYDTDLGIQLSYLSNTNKYIVVFNYNSSFVTSNSIAMLVHIAAAKPANTYLEFNESKSCIYYRSNNLLKSFNTTINKLTMFKSHICETILSYGPKIEL